MSKPINLNLNLNDINTLNAIQLLLLEIEGEWILYCMRVHKAKFCTSNFILDYPASLQSSFNSNLLKQIKYRELVKDYLNIYIQDIFYELDGGGDDVTEDDGDADSMRENLWRDLLRKGRLTEDEKKLMPYEPWEAVLVPDDYLGRLHKHLIQLVGWDESERDSEIVKMIYA